MKFYNLGEKSFETDFNTSTDPKDLSIIQGISVDIFTSVRRTD